ncbi:MAG: proton-conducting transporter membrane subunit [Chlamydiota bacterium]
MNIILSVIAVALGAAFAVPLAGRRRGAPAAIAAAAAFSLLCLSFVIALLVRRDGILLYRAGGWPPPFGICLVLDGLSAVMLVTVNCVALMVALYAADYMRRYTGEWQFYALFLLMLAGMNGMILAGDLFNLFVFLEVAAFSAYALVAFGTGQEELEASFKYAVLGILSTNCLLFGIALLYGCCSSLNMADISLALAGKQGTPCVLFITALFIFGFGLKAALVPFHAWLPDAHSSAPAPISAMLSGVLIKTLGIYALARVLFNVLGMTPAISHVLMALGALSMAAGVVLAVGQWDMKRLLAYHSISQVGYIVLGLGLGTPLGVLGGLFHLVNHSIFKSLLFLNAGAIDYATGVRDLRKMGGLRERMPVTAATSLVASLAISGVPPLNGFWSKLIIIMACVQSGRYGYAVLAALVSMLTLASFMKLQRYAFYGEPKGRWEGVREVPPRMRIAMVVLAALCLTGGLLAVPALSGGFLDRGAAAIVRGTGYASRVREKAPEGPWYGGRGAAGNGAEKRAGGRFAPSPFGGGRR